MKILPLFLSAFFIKTPETHINKESYLYYPICEVVGLLHCGRQKAINTLPELQYAELIYIKKQGCGKFRKGWERNGERSLWHNTQFYDSKNTRAIRQGSWKPIPT